MEMKKAMMVPTMMAAKGIDDPPTALNL